MLTVARYVGAGAYLGLLASDVLASLRPSPCPTDAQVRLSRLRGDRPLLPPRPLRPTARERVSRQRRGRPLLGRSDARRRDVRPTDGDRPQPLPPGRSRRSHARRAPRCSAPSPSSTGCSACSRFRSPRLRFGCSSARSLQAPTSLYYWLLPGIYSYGLLTILSSHFAGRGFPLRVVGFWVIGFALNVAAQRRLPPGPRRLHRLARPRASRTHSSSSCTWRSSHERRAGTTRCGLGSARSGGSCESPSAGSPRSQSTPRASALAPG